MKLHELSEPTKHMIDFASIWTLLAAFLSILPAFATVFTVTWALFRLLETKLAQALIYRATGFDLGAWIDHRKNTEKT